MGERCLDGDEIAGEDRAAHLGFLDGCKNRHALELEQAKQKPARSLRHRFDQQHARHQGIAGEVPLEDRALLRNLRFDDNLLLADIEVDDTIDQVKVFKLHRRAI